MYTLNGMYLNISHHVYSEWNVFEHISPCILWMECIWTYISPCILWMECIWTYLTMYTLNGMYLNLPHLWQISLFSLAKTAHVNALRFFNTGRWIFHTRLWARVTKTLYLNRLEVSNPRWRTMNSLLWIFLEDFRSVQTSKQLTEFWYNQFSFLATSTNKRRSIMR